MFSNDINSSVLLMPQKVTQLLINSYCVICSVAITWIHMQIKGWFNIDLTDAKQEPFVVVIYK